MTAVLHRNGSPSDTNRDMRTGVVEAIPGRGVAEPELLDAVMTLLRRAEYLGLLDPGDGHRPGEPWVWLPAVVAGMTERGLPTGGRWQQLYRTAAWRHLTCGDHNGHDARAPGSLSPALFGAVVQINDQLEMSPQPAGEWAPVIGTLGEELLAELVLSPPVRQRLPRHPAGRRGTTAFSWRC